MFFWGGGLFARMLYACVIVMGKVFSAFVSLHAGNAIWRTPIDKIEYPLNLCNCLPKPAIIWLIAFEQISGDMATEHINGNGTEEPMDTSAAVTHSDHFNTLLEAGLPQKVAEKLDEIYLAGKPKLEPSKLTFNACTCRVFSCVGNWQVISNFVWFHCKMGTAALLNDAEKKAELSVSGQIPSAVFLGISSALFKRGGGTASWA